VILSHPTDEGTTLVRVTITDDFRAFDPHTSSFIDFKANTVIDGDLGRFIAETCPDKVRIDGEPIPDQKSPADDVTPGSDPTPGPPLTPTDDTPSGDETGGDAESDDVDPDPVQHGQDPAGDSSDDSPAGYEPADHTVAEVLAFLRSHPSSAATVIAAERAGKARTTILAHEG
jgi:hypothetical protein